MPQVWPSLVKSVESYINAYPLRATSLAPSTMPPFRVDPVSIFNEGQLTAEEAARPPSVLDFSFLETCQIDMYSTYYMPYDSEGNLQKCGSFFGVERSYLSQVIMHQVSVKKAATCVLPVDFQSPGVVCIIYEI